MVIHGRAWGWVLLAVGAAGCGRTPAPPAGTGAREVVVAFYERLSRRDWDGGYSLLHADSRKRLTSERFARLAEARRHGLGFDPEEVKVQSCDERGAEAVARVVLLGPRAPHRRRYKDAVVLRQSAEGWRVIVGDGFGRRTR